MNTGRNTPQGFLPAEPSFESLLKGIGGGKGGWDQLAGITSATKEVSENREAAGLETKRAFAALFNSVNGRIVMEFLLDQTLRRAPASNEFNSIEAEALHIRERKGQNGIVCTILQMVHDGMNLPEPTVSRASKKKKG